MSVCSKTVISHQGKRPAGMAQRVFCIPDGVKCSKPRDILKLLGRRNSKEDVRAILNKHALHLAYPPAVLVDMSGVSPHAPTETDILTICTVLSKSSDHLYLRDKEPNLSMIRPDRRIALLIPGECP
jgi:hypothetical protein